MNTGCPRTHVHETALQLLQVLDKRFFGAVGPLPTENDAGKTSHCTLSHFMMYQVSCILYIILKCCEQICQ